jgi:hypothetical protein
MKSKVLQRPMFMPPEEVENVGIMQGFMDDMEGIFEEEDDDEGEDYEAGKMMGRTPDSPEILMNNLRGDMRSVDARVEELADMVGYRAAAETPMEVLALLQPVLAGQGIAALPVGGPPGQAMPPMPPAPAAPQMQPAGAPPAMPAGGIASLPQGESAPMAMAKGGLVQYFQDGADENAVTPASDAPFSSDISSMYRDEVQNYITDLMNQRAMAVPSLQKSMEERIPLYQSLMGGGDKDSMRAAMLFDIAQTALGYAGNVGPQGQPLRGSQAARLAGAASALPGQIGARLAAQQQQDQAVRLAALQAAEKDVQAVRESNLDLTKEKRSLMSSLARSPTGSTSSSFGSSMEGRARAFVTENYDLYAQGMLPEEENAQFEMALSIITQPRTEIDPLSLLPVRITPSLPAFVDDALAASGRTPAATTAAEPAETAEGEAVAILERSPLQVKPRSDSYYEQNMPSLFNAATAQGPIPALKSFVFQMPLLNTLAASDAGSVTQGRQFIEATKNALTEGFQAGTDRFSNTERQQLLSDLDVAANVIDRPEAFQTRLFALDDTLQRFQEAALSTYRNTQMPADVRRAAAGKLADIHEIRALIGAPLHLNGGADPRAADIIRNNPVGTPLYRLDSRGMRASVITQRMKDALGAQE